MSYWVKKAAEPQYHICRFEFRRRFITGFPLNRISLYSFQFLIEIRSYTFGHADCNLLSPMSYTSTYKSLHCKKAFIQHQYLIKDILPDLIKRVLSKFLKASISTFPPKSTFRQGVQQKPFPYEIIATFRKKISCPRIYLSRQSMELCQCT